jgi:carbon monoxide dehydrogenase subunit G
MFRVSADIVIDRPPSVVFDFIADNENDPKWCIPVVETVRVSGEAPGVGAR